MINKKEKGVQAMAQKIAYLADTRITYDQFEQIRAHILTGEKLAAIQLIRTWTNLSLMDACHIADNFHTIDFRKPQTILHENTPRRSDDRSASVSKNQEKAQRVVKAVGKGVGTTAFWGGYLGLYVVSRLINPKKRKR